MFSAVYNLVEGIALAETEAKIADYQKKNYDNIVANDARKVITASWTLCVQFCDQPSS